MTSILEAIADNKAYEIIGIFTDRFIKTILLTRYTYKQSFCKQDYHLPLCPLRLKLCSVIRRL